LGNATIERHPELRTRAVPPPSRIRLDSLRTASGDYHAMRGLRLTSVYPVVEGYRSTTAAGVQACFADPALSNVGALTVAVTPRDVPDDERLHVDARYDRYGWVARFH